MSTRRPPVKPAEPRMHRLEVLRSERVSPSFQRVTVVGDDLHEFGDMGFDQWFRLFLPVPGGDTLRLPRATTSLWYAQYLAIPEAERPHCANYTVREFRPAGSVGAGAGADTGAGAGAGAAGASRAELDIDFVLHRGESGELEGGAAIWACAARPGDALGLLDQGVLFNAPDDATEIHLVADETGLPGTEGIVRSLHRASVGSVIQEVPTRADVRPLDAPDGVEVTWVVRDELDARGLGGGEAGAGAGAGAGPGAGAGVLPGEGALAALLSRSAADPRAYAYVVGESALATGGRRHLHAAGLPKNRITFSGYWKR
ncbi:siderophore-interacting protein [Frigoribacterium sp. PhB24]|uniref:siderophore-interacting protein n=1 Tax=Frigoribacterium sp. PhB24 TaxID=2485204 RepID=UPI000F989292|nr:siderophore-interacting protein [Frigoribacterium sp. PhB24]ROS49035.1 NADPH-dependent ferric siderophore reductase [Frigoribacterium sp. PhB24]